MKIILVDPNLVRSFLGNHFFYLNYGAHLGNNYFLVVTKLEYLSDSVLLNVPINHIQKKEKQKEI